MDDELSFEWTPGKASDNLRETATLVFDDRHRLELDDEFSRDEYRTLVTGMAGPLLLTVVYAEPKENLYRLISARLATPPERKSYEEHIFHP